MFVPGDNDRFLKKMRTLPLDVALLDLEDGITGRQKIAGRERTAQDLREPAGELHRFVRVNGTTTPLFTDDVTAIVCEGLSGLCMPKVEHPHEIAQASELLGRLEKDCGLPVGRIKILVAIESAVGVMNAAAIAGADDRVVGLMLGAEDLALDLGLPAHRLGEAKDLTFVRSSLVIAARSVGRWVIDGVYPDYADVDGLLLDIERARQIGFAGKSLFHPSQISHINAGFMPSAKEMERAQRIVDAFDRAEAEGAGAVAVDGQLVDLPIVMRARRTLASAAASAQQTATRIGECQ